MNTSRFSRELIVSFKNWVREQGKQLELDEEEETILERSLENISYEKMGIKNYAIATIKNKGSELFRKLSEVTERDISKRNCKLVLTRIINESAEHTSLPGNEAPAVSDFFGRSQELKELEQLIITDRFRLIGITGMSGIGKTLLMAKFIRKVKDDFDYIIWKSLESSPSLEGILTDIEKYFLVGRSEESVDRRLTNLINCLNQHRCLLVLDQFEAVLGSSEAANYGNLTRRLGEREHKSCLVFISLEPLETMRILQNQLTVREFKVSGLAPEDARNFVVEHFKLRGSGVEKLIEQYAGNPAALKLVCPFITDHYHNDIAEFLNGTLFVNNPLSNLLDRHWDYLNNLEIDIMKYLAQEIEPKLMNQISEHFDVTSVSRSNILDALHKLWKRSLVDKVTYTERNTTTYTVNPFVRKYIQNRYFRR